jgi:hypothetical protein
MDRDKSSCRDRRGRGKHKRQGSDLEEECDDQLDPKLNPKP